MGIDNSHNYDYNIDMKYRNAFVFLYCILGIISLLTGLFVYLIFRPDTYVSRFVMQLISVNLSALTTYDSSFVKFYLADYLWAFSLSCWLHAIFMPEIRGTLLCTVTVFVFGSLYEYMQYTNIIAGTGDIIDSLLYLLAGFTVNIIIIFKEIRK